MKVYIVTEEGMYRHRILGVLHNPGAANHRAEKAAMESDGYHEYDVCIADEDRDITDVVPLVGYKKIGERVVRTVKL